MRRAEVLEGVRMRKLRDVLSRWEAKHISQLEAGPASPWISKPVDFKACGFKSRDPSSTAEADIWRTYHVLCEPDILIRCLQRVRAANSGLHATFG